MHHPAAIRRSTLLLLSLALTPAAARAQFDLQDAHTTASLRGIHAVSPAVAWASGTEGTILRTTDGGHLWQTCTTPSPAAEHLDFRGIQAFDENTAIVMSSGKGDLSRLYKTTDACHTWRLLFTNPDKEGFWDALRFAPAPSRGGAVIGDPVDGRFAIFLSDAEGDAWYRWGRKGLGWNGTPCGERDAKSSKGESLFAASNQALIFEGASKFLFVSGGAHGSRLRTSDYTASDYGFPCKTSFDSQSLPMGGSESSGAFAVAIGDREEGAVFSKMVIVGGDYKLANQSSHSCLYATPRSGVLPFESTFVVAPAQTPPHGYRSSVAYDPATKTWITTGPNGTDISREDGRNWTPLRPGPHDPPDADKNWNALSLPFVVGPHGRIGKLRPDALKP